MREYRCDRRVAAGLVVLALLVFTVRDRPRVRAGRRLPIGSSVGPRGPGLVLIAPGIERTRWVVNLQVDTADIQDIITKDNVTVRASRQPCSTASSIPSWSGVEIRDDEEAIFRIAEITLRAALSQHDLDDLLANQDSVKDEDRCRHRGGGVQVVGVETEDIDLPDTMQRAMARQAEAERGRRAKVIAAEGEYQAAERLTDAARVIGREPHAITLRTLQTLAEVATEQHSTRIIPVPADLIGSLKAARGR